MNLPSKYSGKICPLCVHWYDKGHVVVCDLMEEKRHIGHHYDAPEDCPLLKQGRLDVPKDD